MFCFPFSFFYLHPHLQVYGEVKVGLKLGWYFGIMIALLPATFMIMSVIASIIIEGVPISSTLATPLGCNKFIKYK